MRRSSRRVAKLRRVLPYGLVYALGAFALVVASQLPQPFSTRLGLAGAVLLVLLAPFITAEAMHGRLAPYPESLSSWRAFGDEFAASICATVAICGLVAGGFLLLLVTWPLRLLHLRLGIVYDWWLRSWRAVWRFQTRQFERALARHRAVASQHGELIPVSVRALERAHHRLAVAYVELRRLADGERERGRAPDLGTEQSDAAARHARMALYYAQTFGLPAERGCSRVTMHALLAEHYLAASLKPEPEGGRRLREAGLAALAQAVETRWLFPRLHGKPVGISSHLSGLERLAQHPELQPDPRVATLLEMLKMGTTPERLHETRAAIHAESEHLWWSREEQEERAWAASLSARPGVQPLQ